MAVSRRRLLVLGALLTGAPLAAWPQADSRPRRIGFFYFGSRQSATETGRYAAFLQGMRDRFEKHLR